MAAGVGDSGQSMDRLTPCSPRSERSACCIIHPHENPWRQVLCVWPVLQMGKQEHECRNWKSLHSGRWFISGVAGIFTRTRWLQGPCSWPVMKMSWVLVWTSAGCESYACHVAVDSCTAMESQALYRGGNGDVERRDFPGDTAGVGRMRKSREISRKKLGPQKTQWWHVRGTERLEGGRRQNIY